MKSKQRALPPIFGVAELAAGTMDRENRTVELVFYSGAPILRQRWSWDTDEPEWYEIEFDVSNKAARLDRLNAGAPLIDSHNTYAGVRGGQLGVVEKAWLKDGEGRALVRFSKRDDVEPVWQDVLDGIVRNVSMGTFILEMEEVTEKDAPMKRFRATSWEPYEISLVPSPADAGAQVQLAAATDAAPRVCTVRFRAEASADAPRGDAMKFKVRLLATGETIEIEESEFDEQLHAKLAAAPAEDDTNPVTIARKVDEVKQREQARAKEIKRLCAEFGCDEVFAQRHIHLGTDIDTIIRLATEDRARRAPRTLSDIGSGGGDDRESFSWRFEQMSLALAARAKGKAVPESASQYAHTTMLEMAFECLSTRGLHRGIDVRSNPSRVLELALTSSDFPNLLANAANKMLLPDYQAATPTYRLLAERQDLPDFKTASVLKVGDFPIPLQVGEEGEVKLGKFSEAKDTFALATYGRRLLFAFQAIVNDDLMAFERVMRGYAKRLADFENGLFFTLLTSASGAGPTLGDSVALFHSTHANLTSSGTAIDESSIGVGRALMRKQTGLDGIKLNIPPKYLLTSPEKATLARKYTTLIGPNVAPASQNPWAGMLEPLDDANLTSANPWYLFADPAVAPVAVYGYLRGQAGPDVATRVGFEVLGVEMRVALHFGVAFVDFRGAYRNAGA